MKTIDSQSVGTRNCFWAEDALANIRSLRATLLALDGSCGDDGRVGIALGLAQQLEEQLEEGGL